MSSDSFCHGFPFIPGWSPCVPSRAELETPAHDVMAVSISHFSSVPSPAAGCCWECRFLFLGPLLKKKTPESNRDIPREQQMANRLRLDISPAPILRQDIRQIHTEILDSASRALPTVSCSSSYPDLSTAEGPALHRHRAPAATTRTSNSREPPITTITA
jgi:hypothetical protein